MANSNRDGAPGWADRIGEARGSQLHQALQDQVDELKRASELYAKCQTQGRKMLSEMHELMGAADAVCASDARLKRSGWWLAFAFGCSACNFVWIVIAAWRHTGKL